MPHQCIRCGAEYADGSGTIVRGCDKCGSKFFFFFREKPPETLIDLGTDDRKEIEHDVKDIIGPTKDDRPVILDIESVRITEPGKFEIDLVNLFKRKPVIYKMGDGKYFIDLATTFQLLKKNKK